MTDITLKDMLESFQAGIGLLQDRLANAEVEETVEIGATLWAMVKAVEVVLEQAKGNVRATAVDRLQGNPGSCPIEGTEVGRVTVTIPTPSIQLAKGMDPAVLEHVLGDDFEVFFERIVKLKPRQGVGTLVSSLDEGPTKTMLLEALEQKEGTPRVSFTRS